MEVAAQMAMKSTIQGVSTAARSYGVVTGALRPLAKASVVYNTSPFERQRRNLQTSSRSLAPNGSILGLGNPNIPPSYFQRPSLPANTIIRFVPQQTAWIVERMGKFNRILEPGFAILIPFIDRIAYVKSLKEAAFDIPSQSAITADNVTLELDGVLFTRVYDAYKARSVHTESMGH